MKPLNGKKGSKFDVQEKLFHAGGVDKTLGLHSRPGHKEQLRNANRKLAKGARLAAKRELENND